MNCKPGDLAVIVRSGAGHEGKIVRCLQFVGRVLGYIGDDYWEIDRSLPSTHGDMTPVFQDAWLRPIRDSDGEDETLTWAGKPVDVHAPIERLIPVNPLPHAVGGDPLRTWPDESTAWKDIQ